MEFEKWDEQCSGIVYKQACGKCVMTKEPNNILGYELKYIQEAGKNLKSVSHTDIMDDVVSYNEACKLVTEYFAKPRTYVERQTE